MGQLSGLKPERVFYYFEEISKIPHGSGNTKIISDYLVEFAKKHELKYRQDNKNNVIIWKDGNGEPVIIQGHMDMVCEKEPTCIKDMEKEGLDLYIDGDYIRAKGTTLGGDDGIAVAMALAILESEDKELPPIEAVITVDEEIGMLGAEALDASDIKGKRLLNIDSEDEGVFTVSCAGGCTAECSLVVEREDIPENVCAGYYEIKIENLAGGHSGVEIHKNRANAIQLLGRVLQRIRDDLGIRLIDISGGAKDNAIATNARAVFAIDGLGNNTNSGICELVDKITGEIKGEFSTTDSNIEITCNPVNKNDLCINKNGGENITLKTMSVDCTNKAIFMLTTIPNGIVRMSPDVEGLVQTSLNKGILENVRTILPGENITEDRIKLTLCIRSSVASERDTVMRQARDIMEMIGGKIQFNGVYPGWKYAVDSPLRDLMIDVFTKQYGYAPKVEAIHAGVECGYFADKLPGLDCVSFGPNLREIHTFRESMEIASVERTYKLVLEVLHRLSAS